MAFIRALFFPGKLAVILSVLVRTQEGTATYRLGYLRATRETYKPLGTMGSIVYHTGTLLYGVLNRSSKSFLS